MSEVINWTVKAQAISGPTLTASDTIKLETYVKSSVTVDPVAVVAVVDVDFVASPDVLIVSADKYSEPGLIVTYKVNGAGTAKTLDGPLVLIGKENVKLLSNNPVTKLSFTNNLTTAIHIELLSGNVS